MWPGLTDTALSRAKGLSGLMLEPFGFQRIKSLNTKDYVHNRQQWIQELAAKSIANLFWNSKTFTSIFIYPYFCYVHYIFYHELALLLRTPQNVLKVEFLQQKLVSSTAPQKINHYSATISKSCVVHFILHDIWNWSTPKKHHSGTRTILFSWVVCCSPISQLQTTAIHRGDSL